MKHGHHQMKTINTVLALSLHDNTVFVKVAPELCDNHQQYVILKMLKKKCKQVYDNKLPVNQIPINVLIFYSSQVYINHSECYLFQYKQHSNVSLRGLTEAMIKLKLIHITIKQFLPNLHLSFRRKF